MARVYVGLGSNIEPARHIRGAVTALGERFAALALSPVYESAAVGFSGPNFYNLVASFDTALEVEALLRELGAIEQALGRQRGATRFADRNIDLDLLLYGPLIAHTPVALPRPEILRYAFVLRPLADLAPQERHPVEGRTFAELWADFQAPDQALWPVGLDLD